MRTRSLRLVLVLVLLLAALGSAAPAVASTSGVVISEVRFRGPNGGSDEFIELINAGSALVAIGGWKLEGCSNTGPSGIRATINAGISLAPGQHYLLTNSSTSGGPYSGPVTGDQTYTTGVTDTGGLRLLDGASVLVDAVGTTATTAPCREGAGVASLGTTNANRGYERIGAIQDTGDNAADFLLRAPSDPQKFGPTGGDTAPSVTSTTPPNGSVDVSRDANVAIVFSEPVTTSAAAFTITCDVSGLHAFTLSGGPTSFALDPASDFGEADTCTVTVDDALVGDLDGDDPPDTMAADHVLTFSTTAPSRRIYEIQGASHTSPFAGKLVSAVPGVITAVRPQSFYMQDASGDGLDATSDAILVFVGASTASFSVGDAVLVSGRVTEFQPGGSTTSNLTTTEITSPAVTPAGPGGAIAATIVAAGGRVPPGTVIEDDAFASFDHELDGIDFYESMEAMLLQVNDAVVTGPRNDFGEVWVLGDNGAAAAVRTTRGGIVLRPGDFNPERIQLDDEIVEDSTPAVNVGDEFTSSPKGVLEYNFGNFEILLTSALTRVDNGLVREVTQEAGTHELTVANFNVENLDPSDGAAKFDQLAELIVEHLRSPAILALEEVQDNSGATNDGITDATLTYETLIAAIEEAGGPPYDFRDIAPVDGQDGGEGGGNIRVGFLFRTDVAGLSFRDRPGATSTTANAVVGTSPGVHLLYSPGRIDPTNAAFNSSRKPLAGEFLYRNKRVILIANHFNSKGGDQPLFGRFQPPVRSSEVQRHQQAQIVNDFVDQILAADPKANVVVLGDLNDFEFSTTVDLVEGGVLTTLIETLPGSERYSYVFDGNSQSLDHMLVSHELAKHDPGFDVVHVNSEFAEQASDHDPQVARLDVRGRAVPATER